MREEIGPDNPQYTFPLPLLEYLRAICPGDVKGELKDDAYAVSIDEFCRVVGMERG